MGKTIYVSLDKKVKYLDKRREIKDNFGMPWSIDGFKVAEIRGNKSVAIVFFKMKNNVKVINIMEKVKRIKFIDGEMFINICGLQYSIGTYK